MLTRNELDGLTVVCAITVLAHILTSAWAAWWQDRELAGVRADVADLAGWCWDAAVALGWTGEDDQGPGEDDGPPPDDPEPDPDPGEQPDEPPTVISHPADLFARKAALLARRYAHTGEHRQ